MAIISFTGFFIVKSDNTTLQPNITMYILHTVPYTFPYVLKRRIWVTIKSFFSCHHFLCSPDINEWFGCDIVGRN